MAHLQFGQDWLPQPDPLKALKLAQGTIEGALETGYLGGWQEKETRAAMAFGRCFEKAIGAYFCGEDCAAVLFKEWGAFRESPFEYKREIPGIAWSTKASTFSNDLCKTIGS